MEDVRQSDAPAPTTPAPRRSRSGPVVQPRLVELGEGSRRPLRFSLEGKTAIVTGAGLGIGRSIAWILAEHCAKVMVLDLDGGPAEEAAAGIRAPPPSRAVATDQPPDDPLDDSTPEPTDEELWLEETARQVEADARPGLRPRPRLPLSAEPSNSTTTEPPT